MVLRLMAGTVRKVSRKGPAPLFHTFNTREDLKAQGRAFCH